MDFLQQKKRMLERDRKPNFLRNTYLYLFIVLVDFTRDTTYSRILFFSCSRIFLVQNIEEEKKNMNKEEEEKQKVVNKAI